MDTRLIQRPIPVEGYAWRPMTRADEDRRLLEMTCVSALFSGRSFFHQAPGFCFSAPLQAVAPVI
jgi:hypothetical protein